MAQTQSDVKISFCLPVYNVKKYVSECIQSIYNQDIDDFEIICVDDCSTDGSQDELERLAKKYKEIRIILNECNKGVCYSRNAAIKNSRGEYIWFVDPDDMLAPNAAKRYLEIADKTSASVVVGKCIAFSDGLEPPVCMGSDNYEYADFTFVDKYYSHDQNGTISFGVWLGLIKRSIFQEKDLFFREDIKAFEDVLFYAKLGCTTKDIIRVDYYGYYYRITSSSVSHSRSAEKNMSYCNASIVILNELEYLQNYAPLLYRNTLNDIMVYIEWIAVVRMVGLPDRGYIREKLKDYKVKGYYPYDNNYASKIINNKYESGVIKSRGKSKILKWMLNIEPFFWIIHYMYRFLKLVRK